MPSNNIYESPSNLICGQSPKVSVITPVYNTEQYVGEAIESILSQSFSDFEYLIVDDGSTDGTADILQSYANQDSRIRLQQQPNSGAVAARNTALSIARGEFVAIMDADDISMPDRLERQVSYLEENPDNVVVGSQATLIDVDGIILRDFNEVPLTHEEIDAMNLAGQQRSVIHSTATIRRSAITNIGGYREFAPTEDFDLFMRLAEQGRLANLPDALLKRRFVPASLYRTHQEQAIYHRQQIILETVARRGLSDSYLPDSVQTKTLASRDRMQAGAALSQGAISDARRYALRALRRSPLSKASWRTLACCWLDDKALTRVWKFRDFIKRSNTAESRH